MQDEIQYINPEKWTSGIYRITSPNGYYYYGSTSNFYRRFTEHKTALYNNRHPNPKIQNVYNKHSSGWGFEAIEFVELNSELLKNNEQPYISENIEDVYCMNINPKSSIPPSQKGKIPWNKNTKGVMKAWNKGKTQPSEVREKIRISLKGRKGAIRTPEWRLKLSLAGKKRKGIRRGPYKKRSITDLSTPVVVYKNPAETLLEKLSVFLE